MELGEDDGEEEEDGAEGEEGEEQEDEGGDEKDKEEGHKGSQEPSSGRASGSISSLGHPVSSRYPFQFWWPSRGTSASMSSTATPHSHSTCTLCPIPGLCWHTGRKV